MASHKFQYCDDRELVTACKIGGHQLVPGDLVRVTPLYADVAQTFRYYVRGRNKNPLYGHDLNVIWAEEQVEERTRWPVLPELYLGFLGAVAFRLEGMGFEVEVEERQRFDATLRSNSLRLRLDGRDTAEFTIGHADPGWWVRYPNWEFLVRGLHSTDRAARRVAETIAKVVWLDRELEKRILLQEARA